jgi:hypothetical protein
VPLDHPSRPLAEQFALAVTALALLWAAAGKTQELAGESNFLTRSWGWAALASIPLVIWMRAQRRTDGD